MKVRIHCDGGARGNPGPAAAAFVVLDENGAVVKEQGVYLGVSTNNQAEYAGVLAAMEWLTSQKDVERADFYLDSELVVKQLTGQYKIKNENLKVIALKIKRLQQTLQAAITFTHILRSKNTIADALVNQSLDSAQM